jgi:hypothetical protein
MAETMPQGCCTNSVAGTTAAMHPAPKVDVTVDDDLSPLQQSIIESLGVPPDWEPLPASLVPDLEAMLLDELAPIADMFTPDEPLRVNKHFLGTVHGCETHFLANRDKPFAWTVPMVRGTVAHKAIELMINWRGPAVPAELVDAAITSIVENPRESAAAFLETLPAHDLSELRGQTVQLVTNFGDCFPPIKPQWRPMVEYATKYALFGGSVLLTARMDLVLGAPGRRVIIDLKSGYIGPSHRDDLRFYALVESLRSRRTPRRLGTYSLESARLDHEEVTEGVLQAAVRRTARGVLLMADLVGKTRQPEVRPGNQCRWCPLNETCEAGVAHMRMLHGSDDNDW